MNFIKELFLSFTDFKATDRWDIQVKLIDKKTKRPITGDNFTVRFYDKDDLENDFLGEGKVDSSGVADIRFDVSLMQAGAENKKDKNETMPDLFFDLLDNGKVVFTSKVLNNVNFERNASFDLKDGKEINFGTFLIDLQKQDS